MICEKARLSGFSTTYWFQCENCGHEVELDSAGSSGVFLAGGIIAAGVITLIMWSGKGLDRTEIIIAALLFALFTAPSMIWVIKNHRYPLTGIRLLDGNSASGDIDTTDDVLQKGIIWFSAFGFLKGFF